jgi:DNA-directed RNA polymerase subunit RPC12/RpoP
MRIECSARELHKRIDEAWQRERGATCPECDGSRLSEDRTICWDCQASDYLIEEETA